MIMEVNERLMITIAAVILAAATHHSMYGYAERWRKVGYSTLLLTGVMLAFYLYVVTDASHGIGVLILPIMTLWLVWRKHHTGKPDLTPGGFILGQVLYTFLFIAIVCLQE